MCILGGRGAVREAEAGVQVQEAGRLRLLHDVRSNLSHTLVVVVRRTRRNRNEAEVDVVAAAFAGAVGDAVVAAVVEHSVRMGRGILVGHQVEAGEGRST